MKLPKGAFPVNGGGFLPLAWVVRPSPHVFGKVEIMEWYETLPGEWDRAAPHVLTRQEARKLVRRLLKAIDTAEALEHGAKLVRRGRR